MIVARYFGWSAVASRPMDWAEFQIARQMLAEEHVGSRVREAVAEEEAQASATAAAIRKRG